MPQLDKSQYSTSLCHILSIRPMLHSVYVSSSIVSETQPNIGGKSHFYTHLYLTKTQMFKIGQGEKFDDKLSRLDRPTDHDVTDRRTDRTAAAYTTLACCASRGKKLTCLRLKSTDDARHVQLILLE